MERCLQLCRGRRTAAKSSEHGNFSFWTGVAFSVNYILGTGFLALPQAFANTGLLLAPLIVTAIALVMNATKDYLLDALSRGEALSQLKPIVQREWKRHAIESANGAPLAITLRSALLAPSETDGLLHAERKLELGDLIFVMFGSRARTAWATLLSVYIYGALWAYASVFAVSFTANVPIFFLGGTCNASTDASGCSSHYLLWLAVFSAISIVLACRDLKEQVFVQLIMFGARVLVILLLTLTIAAATGCDGVAFAQVPPGRAWGSLTPLAAPGSIGTLLPVAVYAFVFHHSVPVLSQPMADTRRLPLMFAAAFAGICASYLAIGVAVGGFFGGAVASSCNLEWAQYVGCLPAPPGFVASAADNDVPEAGRLLLGAAASLGAAGGGCNSTASWSADCVDVGARPWWAAVIAFVVVTFPAVDVLSAYPLKAITLGNNLMGATFGEAALLAPPEQEGGDGGGGDASGDSSSVADEQQGLLPLLTPPPSSGSLAADAAGGSRTATAAAVSGFFATAVSAAQPRGAAADWRRLSKSSDDVGVADPASQLPVLLVGVSSTAATHVSTEIAADGATAQSGGSGDGGLAAAREIAFRTAGRGNAAAAAVAPRRRKLVGAAGSGGESCSDREGGLSPSVVGDSGGGCGGGGGGGGALLSPAAAATGSPSSSAGGSPAPSRSPVPPAPLRPWAVRTPRRYRCTRTAFRVAAAVPPLMGAAFVRDLGAILKWTGILGVVVVFAVPAALQLRSLAVLRAAFVRASMRLWAEEAAAAAADVETAAEPPATGGDGDAEAPREGGLRGTSSHAAACVAVLRAATVGLPSCAEEEEAAAASEAESSTLAPHRPADDGGGGVDAACAQALAAATRGGTPWRDSFRRAPAVDALLCTPYASWAAWRAARLPEAVLAMSAALVVGIVAEVARSTAAAAH